MSEPTPNPRRRSRTKNICDINPRIGAAAVLESDRLLYEHGARIRVLEQSRSEDKVHIEGRFTRIENAINCSDKKLDKILEAQAVSAALREETEKAARKAISDVAEKTIQTHNDAEFTAAQREKRIASYTGIISGLVFVVVGEFVRWYLQLHWGNG